MNLVGDIEKKAILREGWDYQQLWNGCILASIAHAMMVAHYPEISNEHSWDGFNYSVQDNQGTRGTITFCQNSVVAAFRNDNIETINQPAIELFQGSPKKIIEIASTETLLYLYESIGGRDTPVITTGFWGERNQNQIYSSHPINTMIDNGGAILKRQVMEFSSAINAWQEYYEMNDEQVLLLKGIYKRKIANPSKKMYLTMNEINMIGTVNEEGLEESNISFGELGIFRTSL
nr:hypothetical protein [Sutcliffiella horikoshii]